jgi:hypothetical protein
MTTHQKDARLFMQLNHPDIEMYCHNLPEPDRAFARAKAREIDAAKLPAKESEAQARADCKAAEEGRKEAEKLRGRREAKDAAECRMIEGFQPILDLETFLALPNSKPPNDFLKRQLVWHRRIGLDSELPSGIFSGTNKAALKKFVVEALGRFRGKANVDVTDAELGTVAVVKGAPTTHGRLETTAHRDSL